MIFHVSLEGSGSTSLSKEAGQTSSASAGGGANPPPPENIGVPPTSSQNETMFLSFMAGMGAMGGEALAGPAGALGGAMLGTAVGIGMENFSKLPLSVQLGVNPYAPQ